MDQQSRNTLVAMLAQLSSALDHFEKLQPPSTEVPGAGGTNEGNTARKSVKRPRIQEEIGSNGQTQNMNTHTDSAQNAPLKSLKRLRIDDYDHPDRSRFDSNAQGAEEQKKAKVENVDETNQRTVASQYDPTETEDISEEVERRLREKEERHRRSEGRRDTKRKRDDDHDWTAQRSTEDVPTQQNIKRLRTTSSTPDGHARTNTVWKGVSRNDRRKRSRPTSRTRI
ncbi:hypothetical protein AAP_00108 [Ascosphaera apis ARSEF 7405]|uniref:Uncharacterized protein n=1 Tax=Ascosphaera apis ARSEF 7405 TaxID=392613 RepID=A0A168DKP4_9EURO|nr:hypothetical protein AAP_00108 [Ascosphaera apis ARSEF 7405]